MPIESVGRVFSTRLLVNCMIRAGYHDVARTPGGKRGMAEDTYRRLWPKEVVQPSGYAGRFDEILLVDLTIRPTQLVLHGQFYTDISLDDARDLTLTPIKEDGTPMQRYIAFVDLGEKNLDRTVKNCQKECAPDAVALVTAEGLYLPVQHKAHLRKFGVDLAGVDVPLFFRQSLCGALCVSLFKDKRPKVSVREIEYADSQCGSAFRGKHVIAVA